MPLGDLGLSNMAINRGLLSGPSSLWTSEDGIHWEGNEEFLREVVLDVAFHDGTWIAVGRALVATSTDDGANWQKRTDVSSGFLEAVGYGNGKWVIGSYEGEIYSSPDGASWTQRRAATNIPEVIVGATYGGGYWTLPAREGVFASQDGVTWEKRPAGRKGNTLTQISSVFYTNGHWIAMGSNFYLSTEDPMNWPDDQARFGQESVHAMCQGPDGRFVWVGEAGSIHTGFGFGGWTTKDTGVTHDLFALENAQGHMVAVGDMGTIVSSSDTTTWTTLSSGTGQAAPGDRLWQWTMDRGG